MCDEDLPRQCGNNGFKLTETPEQSNCLSTKTMWSSYQRGVQPSALLPTTT